MERDLVVTALKISNNSAHAPNVKVASVVCLIDTETSQGVVISSVANLALTGRGFVGNASMYSLVLSIDSTTKSTFDVDTLYNETQLYVVLSSTETIYFENFTDATLSGTLKLPNSYSGNGMSELNITTNLATLVHISDTRTSSAIEIPTSPSTTTVLIHGAGFDNPNAQVNAVLGFKDIYDTDGTTVLYTCSCTSQFSSPSSITVEFSYIVLHGVSINTTCTTCTVIVSNLTYDGISIGSGTSIGETLSVVETVLENVIQSSDNGAVTIYGSGFGNTRSDAYSVTLSAKYLGASSTVTSCDGTNNIADNVNVSRKSPHMLVVTGLYVCLWTFLLSFNI